MVSAQLLHPQVLDCVLNHPSIAQHQQTICLLLSTSKAGREAVTARLRGQLPVQLTVACRQKQKVLQLAAWLATHAPLVQRLTLQLSDFERRKYQHWDDPMYDLWASELEKVAAALQQVASADRLFLQHFCLQGMPATPGLLAALPTGCLTSLDCEARGGHYGQDPATKSHWWSDSIACISQLSQLRQLNISKTGLLGATEAVLQSLSCLQQLTKLELGEAHVNQLQQLPPNLQQLEVAVRVHRGADVDRLANWTQQHAGTVTSLTVDGNSIDNIDGGSLTAALRNAAAEAASGQLQLKRLTVHGVRLSSAVYAALGSCCMMESLSCWLYGERGERPIVLANICSLASLRELALMFRPKVEVIDVPAVAWQQMSGLTNLTKLALDGVPASQLCCLPVQLKDLEVDRESFYLGDWADGTLALGHLRCMTGLSICGLTTEDDILPPNLVSLRLDMVHTTLQPLAVLHMLRELHLRDQCESELMTGQELLMLSRLTALTEVTISYLLDENKTLDASHFDAFSALPLKGLCIGYEEKVDGFVISMLSTLQGLTALELSGCFPCTPSLGLCHPATCEFASAYSRGFLGAFGLCVQTARESGRLGCSGYEHDQLA